MKRCLTGILTLLFVCFIISACGVGLNKAAGQLNDLEESLDGSIEIEAEEEIQAKDEETMEAEAVEAEITMWTFPIGGFGDEDVVNGFVSEFHKLYPEIKVNVEILDYATGDEKVEEAIQNREAPDLIMEGPERIVANWGARGLLIDLQDMWDDETISDISATSEEVVDACQAPDGAFYQYPMVMTTHVMAINYDIFKEAGALRYIDEETRSWTTDDFVKAMELVRDSGLVETPGIVYCGGQGGDQGTRALVTNLYDAPFTNEDYNEYLINEERGIQGLELLVEMVSDKSLSYNTEMQAVEELQAFAAGESAITLAWNATNEDTYADEIEFTPFAMNFPSNDGSAELQGGIWGFGIFNNGDPEKITAAKLFIEFLVDDPTQREESIRATNFFPVNSSCGNVYTDTEGEERMEIYMSFLPNLGEYYQVTLGWPEQRVAWYEMLQMIFNGKDVEIAADEYAEKLNSQFSPQMFSE